MRRLSLRPMKRATIKRVSFSCPMYIHMTMMNTITEPEDHFGPDKYLDIEEEKMWKVLGYAKDSTGKWIHPEGDDSSSVGRERLLSRVVLQSASHEAGDD
jgi:hypothetical protein